MLEAVPPCSLLTDRQIQVCRIIRHCTRATSVQVRGSGEVMGLFGLIEWCGRGFLYLSTPDLATLGLVYVVPAKAAVATMHNRPLLIACYYARPLYVKKFD